MARANERGELLSYPTPISSDVLFYEVHDGVLPKNYQFEYGSPHPNSIKWPYHELVFIAPARARAGQGDSYYRYYAAKRENQDLYNFEFTKAEAGSFKFDSIRRTYFIKRDEFDPNSPIMGSANPDEPEGRFDEDFVLFQRQQIRSQIQELDSLYVTEVRIYIRRVTIGEVKMDRSTGLGTRSTTVLYHRGEVVDGVEISLLAEDPNSTYWGLQPDGSFRELEQISEDWFAVTEARAYPMDSELGSDNPARSRVVTRVTPLGTDLVFYEVGAMPDPAPAYGTSHYDDDNWPDHELVFIEPADANGFLYRFYYAAERDSQDSYNFEDNEGGQLSRTYLVKRSEYLDRSNWLSSVPEVGTPDAVFNQYVFAQESVIRVGDPLDSLFVAVRRDFLPPFKRDIEYNDALERNVVITRRIIPHGTGSGSSETGLIVEVQDVNTWYDIEITREVEGLDEVEFPIQLVSIPRDVPYDFPPLLKSVSIVSAWAVAASTDHPRSYDEDFYIDYNLSDPAVGPYEGQVLRFITDDPDSLRADYPLVKITTKRETASVVYAWYWASDKGNSTRAIAKQLEIPSSIHDEITIPEPLTGGTNGSWTNTLPATPDFEDIVEAEEMVVGYETRKIALNLFEVNITIINTVGLYDV